MNQSPREKIDRLTRTLLAKETDGTGTWEATHGLCDIFDRLSRINWTDKALHADSSLQNGVAVSPSCAAECGRDVLRVNRFLQGVDMAITSAIAQFHPEIVHLLYAGCGPYAILILPLLTRYCPDQLQVTFLDCHKISLESVRRIINALGFNDFIRAYVLADATIYQHKADDPIHMVLSETMTAALAREMQVPITLNLAPQMIEGGILIPESIRVKVILARPELVFQKRETDAKPPYPPFERIQELGTIFTLGKAEGCILSAMGNEAVLPAGTITYPKNVKHGYQPFLMTEITIYRDVTLSGRDSTLNHLIGLPPGFSGRWGTTETFAYRLGRNPGFVKA